MAGRLMRSSRRDPRGGRPRPALQEVEASFQVNMGRARAGNKSAFRLAKMCSATGERESSHPAPAPRRSVDALRNAGLYSARMYHLYGALLTLAWAAVLPYQMVMAFLRRTTLP